VAGLAARSCWSLSAEEHDDERVSEENDEVEGEAVALALAMWAWGRASTATLRRCCFCGARAVAQAYPS
jgi:hypothetical protein